MLKGGRSYTSKPLSTMYQSCSISCIDKILRGGVPVVLPSTQRNGKTLNLQCYSTESIVKHVRDLRLFSSPHNTDHQLKDAMTTLQPSALMRLPCEIQRVIARYLEFPDNMNLRMAHRLLYERIDFATFEEALQAEYTPFARQQYVIFSQSCNAIIQSFNPRAKFSRSASRALRLMRHFTGEYTKLTRDNVVPYSPANPAAASDISTSSEIIETNTSPTSPIIILTEKALYGTRLERSASSAASNTITGLSGQATLSTSMSQTPKHRYFVTVVPSSLQRSMPKLTLFLHS